MRSVSEIMTAQLVTFSPEMSIHEAIRILLERRFSGAPVVDADGALVGVLSKKDCLRIVFSTSYYRDRGGQVREYMSADVDTIDADTDIVTASRVFLESHYRRFPVLHDGGLVGQVSRCDLLQALIEEA